MGETPLKTKRKSPKNHQENNCMKSIRVFAGNLEKTCRKMVERFASRCKLKRLQGVHVGVFFGGKMVLFLAKIMPKVWKCRKMYKNIYSGREIREL